jgi:putative NADPH-quinone reductase
VRPVNYRNASRRAAPRRAAIVAARHLLIVFPLWHGTMPAPLVASVNSAQVA